MVLDGMPDQYDAVVETRDRTVPIQPGDGFLNLTVPGPAGLRFPNEEMFRERWAEVRTRPGNELVTAVLVRSLWDKSPDGSVEYDAKLRDLLRRNLNWVEIDLLVGGRRSRPAGRLPRGDYYAFVSRAGCRESCGVYDWSVRDRLPTIPVPLRSPDPDVPLDLAAAFATSFDQGKYGRRLRYDRPPPAPLAEADRAWAADVAGRPR